jgi:type IV secretory pathway VirB10-like protein
MDRAERTGLGIATAGHVLLFAALSLGLLTTSKPKPPMNDPMEVQLVDEIGLRSAMPELVVEPPAPSEAPEAGPPEEVTPPEPSPAVPAPTPAPPQPAPKPAPVPKPQPKAAPAKPVPDQTPRRRPDKPVEKPRGTRLGPDFLKGISPEKSAGKAATPRAAVVDARALAGLAAAIAAQVKPCYVVPAGGTDAGNIVTVLRLRFKPDGSTATTPSVAEQSGVTAANAGYARQMGEAAKRAVLRCSPLRLPAELYEGGWEDIEFVFNPQMMG